MAIERRTDRSVQELREQVTQLRDAGLSFSRIAVELGISKSYAVKLSQPTGSQPAVVRVDRLNLSVRERKFARGLMLGQTHRQAALAAAPTPITPSGADSWANRTLHDQQFQNEFQKLLYQAGLGEEQLARVHAEALEATRVVTTRASDGRITVLEHPDHPTRLRAAALGWELHGRRHPSLEDAQQPPIVINITRDQAVKLGGLIGRPPPDWLLNGAQRDTQDPQENTGELTPSAQQPEAVGQKASAEDEGKAGSGQARAEPHAVPLDQCKPWEF